jgi:hypothetical protein
MSHQVRRWNVIVSLAACGFNPRIWWQAMASVDARRIGITRILAGECRQLPGRHPHIPGRAQLTPMPGAGLCRVCCPLCSDRTRIPTRRERRLPRRRHASQARTGLVKRERTQKVGPVFQAFIFSPISDPEPASFCTAACECCLAGSPDTCLQPQLKPRTGCGS